MSTTTCTTSCLPTYTPRFRRALDWISQRWQAARRAALRRQQLHALSSLSEDTLRDIGMSEYMPPRPLGYTLDDFERGRW